jgi:uncharacterized repeat protein (TIGR01451 family)
MTYSRKWLAPAGVLALFPYLASAQQYLISTFAGGLPAPTAAKATSYPLGAVNAVATDRFGNTYVSTSLNCVFRVDATGMIERIAGNGQGGYSGDGGSALAAQLNGPQGVAIDTAGKVYIADQYNQRIRMVDLTGTITTVAGTGLGGYNGDGQPATSAQLNDPRGIAVDAAGNLYIADFGNERIREVAGGNIATIAGTGAVGSAGDGGPATSATLTAPTAVALDAAGDLYIADLSNKVRKVVGGVITRVAGAGSGGYSGDGGLAVNAALDTPAGLTVDPTGNLYIADEFNSRIRKVDVYGIITTFAGGGTESSLLNSYPATSALLHRPVAVSADAAGNIYIGDQFDNCVRVVNVSGTISTAAGNGVVSYGGDSGPASLAQFSTPRGIAGDEFGNLYVADAGNDRVRQINANGVVSTAAGTGGSNYNLVNGELATQAIISANSVATDAAGDFYVGDDASVAEVFYTGDTISMVAGTGSPGNSGIGGPATAALLSPIIPGIALDQANNLYLSDSNANKVLAVNASHNINAVAGTGTGGYNGDGGQGTAEELNSPGTLAWDPKANILYIADTQNNRVRALASNSTLSTVTGNGTFNDSGDGGAAASAGISTPQGLAVDAASNLYVATAGNKIRMVVGGNISTIAGTGNAGYSGDGGPATSALLQNPAGMAVDSLGNIYICDSTNNAIRVLQPAGSAPLFAVSTIQQGQFTLGQIGAAYSVTVSNAALAGASNGLVVVTEMVPAGLTLTGMEGNGWSCSVQNSNCQRSDPLQPGHSYDAISIFVNVNSNAPPQVTNAVTVSGGGSLGAASSFASFIGPPVPMLQVSASSSGVLVAGQNATYTITVGNQTGAPTTTQPVTVTEDLPSAGLTLTSMGGTGWNCSAGSSCSRSEGLAGGTSYPPIQVVAAIATSAPAQVSNEIDVTGGGSAGVSATVVSSVSTPGCAIDGMPANVTGVQILINEALGVTGAIDDLNQDGAVSIVDVQIEINAALGMTCVL